MMLLAGVNEQAVGTETVWPTFNTASLASPATFATTVSAYPGNLSVTTQELVFLVELLHQVDGGFVAHIPAMPGASTQGATYEEAIEMANESIRGMLKVVEKGDLPSPKEIEFMSGPGDYVVTVRVPMNEAA